MKSIVPTFPTTPRVLLLLLLVACGGPSGDDDGGGDDDGSGEPPPPEPATHFAGESSWTTPAWPTDEGVNATGGFAGYSGAWSTLDLDGDQRPDLVWTAPAGELLEHGQGNAPHWKVYLNTGDGFAAQPIQWTTPAWSTDEGVNAIGGFAGYSGAWSTLDLDGDKRPDLVWTAPAGELLEHGQGSAPHWKVYLNTGTGFAAQPIQWTTPAWSTDEGVNAISGYAGYAGAWSTLDLDGDQRPDLVWTAPAGELLEHGQGSAPHWKVYVNTGTGFAAQPIQWTTPAWSTDEGVNAIGGSAGYSGAWSTLDLDGDKRPDLVWTAPAGELREHGQGGAPHWKVYLNTGTAFAAQPIQWTTPAWSTADGVNATGGYAGDTGAWSTLDLDGDRRPDLVWTAPAGDLREHGQGSAPHWKVYLNTTTGFAAQPLQWTTPGWSTADGVNATGGFAGDTGAWSTMDLDGDQLPDLVWTAPAGELLEHGQGSAPHWKLFVGQP